MASSVWPHRPPHPVHRGPRPPGQEVAQASPPPWPQTQEEVQGEGLHGRGREGVPVAQYVFERSSALCLKRSSQTLFNLRAASWELFHMSGNWFAALS